MSEETNDITEAKVEVIDQAALATIQGVEIDRQVATAHQYPRSLAIFKRKAMEMATLDEETARACLYALPRKDHGVTKMIEGESIRMAEIVASSFGNLRIQSTIINQTPTRGTVRAVCHDLENNVAISVEKQYRTCYKDGRPYNDDMQIMAANAASSKAVRDAVFRVVPKSMIKTVTNAAKALAWGEADGKPLTMTQRRENVMKWIGSLGIDKSRVWSALGIKGEDDIGMEQLSLLGGIRTAINEKDTTVDEAFPKPVTVESMTGGLKVEDAGNKEDAAKEGK